MTSSVRTRAAEAVPRFDAVTRVVHWLTAADGLVVLATASVLYVPALSAQIGRRATIMEIHVVAGLLLPAPLLVATSIGPRGARLARDLVALWRWTVTDRQWLRRGKRAAADGKFNGGQKLVTALFAGLFLMQLLTGSVMYWNGPFSSAWRTGATFVHDWVYLGLFVVVVGHVLKAIGEPELLRSMVTGAVPGAWARRARPGWDPEVETANGARPLPATTVPKGTQMLIRLVGGVLVSLLGVVWILQGLDIAKGSGMSGEAIWAVAGTVLLLVGVVLLRAANATRSARS
jgi:formate dehydrogenase subunit gamma